MVEYINNNTPSQDLAELDEDILKSNTVDYEIQKVITLMETYAIALTNAGRPININDAIDKVRTKLKTLREESQRQIFKVSSAAKEQRKIYRAKLETKEKEEEEEEERQVFSPTLDIEDTKEDIARRAEAVEEAGQKALKLKKERAIARVAAREEGIAIAKANVAQQLQESNFATLSNPNAQNEAGTADDRNYVLAIVAEISKRYVRMAEVWQANKYLDYMADCTEVIKDLTPMFTINKNVLKLDEAYNETVNRYATLLSDYTARNLNKRFGSQFMNDMPDAEYSQFIYYYAVYKFLRILSKTSRLSGLTASMDKFYNRFDLDDAPFVKYIKTLNVGMTTGFTKEGTPRVNMPDWNKFPAFLKAYNALVIADKADQARDQGSASAVDLT